MDEKKQDKVTNRPEQGLEEQRVSEVVNVIDSLP